MHAVEEYRNSAEAAPRRRAPAPIVGAVFGLVLLLAPVALGARGLLLLWSLGGLLIVGGGVIAVAFMSFGADEVREALAAVVAMFREPAAKAEDLGRDLAHLLKWSRLLAKSGSLRSFEAGIGEAETGDGFLKYGLNMVLSDYPPEEVRDMLDTAAEAGYLREAKIVDILQAMASHAPAFGMVGTLCGMVALLGNLGDNMAAVAPSLAVAFLSTLYGVLSARMVYMPAAARLRQEIETRRFRRHFLGEGLMMLAAKKPPMQIQDRLNSFLRPDAHDYFDYFERRGQKAEAPRLRVIGA